MTTQPLKEEAVLSETDALYLRQAIRLSHTARDRGNRPFGAVIVGKSGEVLVEFYNQSHEAQDCTAHAETGVFDWPVARTPGPRSWSPLCTRLASLA